MSGYRWSWLGVWLGLLWWRGCVARPTMPAPTPTPSPAAEAVRQALLRALDLEMARYRRWLQAEADPDRQAAYRAALDALQAEYQRVQALPAAQITPDLLYHAIPGVEATASLPPDPRREVDDAWVETATLPTDLFYAGQSRSGPFYTVVGLAPGVTLEPERHYRVRLRLLMRATYPFPHYYVLVEAATPRP